MSRTPYENKWLLAFYSVPSKPVNNRMKLWRRLAKAGAVPLKGAVYALPYSEEHHEFFEWLISEVISLGGDGAFVTVTRVEPLKQSDVIALFNQQREKEYHAVEKNLEELERKINSVRKGGGNQDGRKLFDQLGKHKKAFEEIERIDFFSSKDGLALRKRITMTESALKSISSPSPREKAFTLAPRRIEDYQEKTWITRKRPFVDRMASAWFIRRFIDGNARFKFAEEQKLVAAGEKNIVFDARGGDFTHVGALCTFEVLVKSFGVKDKTLKMFMELVHELDVKDGKYEYSETRGIEDILIGIRKTAKSDAEALERGMEVFEMLYVSKN